MVDQTVIGKDRGDKTTHNHSGKEIRHVRNGLCHFFEMLVFHFIDQKRQDDRCRKIQHQHPEVQDNRIFQDVPEIRIHDKLFEILDSYKFAARKSKKCIVIKECDAQPGHSTIFENNEVQKR